MELDITPYKSYLKELYEKEKDLEWDQRSQLSKLYQRYWNEDSYREPTFIRGYLECPIKQFVQYFDPTPSPYLNRGSCVHECFQNIIEGREINVHDLCVKWQVSDEHIEYVYQCVKNFKSFITKPLFNGKSISELKCYTEKFISGDLSLLGENVKISGSMDLVIMLEDRIVVIDYKTGQYSKFSSDGYKFQMNCYKWLVEQVIGKPCDVYLWWPQDEILDKMEFSLYDEACNLDTILIFREKQAKFRETGILVGKENFSVCKWCKDYCKNYKEFIENVCKSNN